MVQQPRRGVIPPQPRRPERRRPSHETIVRRRVVALGVLLLALALVGWAVAGFRGGGKKAAPKPTVPVAPKPMRIVFPEGFTRAEMASRIAAVDVIAEQKRHVRPLLSKERYLAITGNRRLVPRGFAKAPSLEGFLFPATYDFTRRTTTRQLVLAQLQAFRRNWSRVDLSYARSRNLTSYDVLTIASMVEKEAVAPDERAKVARVIYNRLRIGMKLGIDATIRYALNVPGTESLRQSQLSSNSPYNTRVHYGLPPTPIANPGLASIQAAAHPDPGNWLYYVAAPDKVHSFFTASAAAFERYKATHGYR